MGDRRGLGRYARAVLRELVQRADLRVVLVVDSLVPALARKPFEHALQRDRFAVARRIPSGTNVAWHPWNRIRLAGNLPHVVTIADVAPFRFPHPDPQRREHQQAPFRRAVQQGTRIITFSRASATDIRDYLNAEPQRIRVTHLGVDPIFHAREVNKPEETRRPYFLFVGDPQEERKNFGVLYEGFCRAWPTADGPTLLVAATEDPRLPGIEHCAADDARLATLYAGALATCVPARYEGFGLPAIESMASGTPVLASDASSLPEVCGDAALLLPPDDADAWALAMKRIATEDALRIELSARGLKRAADFQWDRCAEQTLAILQEAAYSNP